MGESFEQMEDESAKAFAAFSLYLSLGDQRSLELVGRKLGKCKALMERWSTRFHWSERVQAHAMHLAKIEREATEALVRGKSAEWLKRQQTLRETEWDL